MNSILDIPDNIFWVARLLDQPLWTDALPPFSVVKALKKFFIRFSTPLLTVLFLAIWKGYVEIFDVTDAISPRMPASKGELALVSVFLPP